MPETATSKPTSVQGTRWALMSRFDIPAKDGSGDVYLARLRIVQTPWFGVYLHHIHQPDSDRDPHDHPWTFLSVILRGSYVEQVWPLAGHAGYTLAHHRRFSAHRMGRASAHKIMSVSPSLVTLIVTGPRRREWGFWQGSEFVPWQTYVAAEMASGGAA
jgi:hypothetical protein